MTDLPEITAIEYHEYKPGDMFIIHVDEGPVLNEEIAVEIARRFRDVMRLPADVPIAIFHNGMRVEVFHDDQPSAADIWAEEHLCQMINDSSSDQ